jgi:succinate dehydrogenase hydrophobic anchor subunit
MKTMTVINTILHLAVFVALLVMYYRMYTQHQPEGFLKKMSWYILKVAMVIMIAMHGWTGAAAISEKVEIPFWVNAVNWPGSILCLVWAEVVHRWNNVAELKKEIGKISKVKHAVK